MHLMPEHAHDTGKPLSDAIKRHHVRVDLAIQISTRRINNEVDEGQRYSYNLVTPALKRLWKRWQELMLEDLVEYL